MKPNISLAFLSLLFALILGSVQAQNGETYLNFPSKDGPGKGKHVVLLAADDEYRSEESMPMLAKILSHRYGFETTVLFAIEPESGNVVPNFQNNIPNLQALEGADLMIMLIRFRELPDEQSKFIEDYVKSGKPIIALRTSTHPFAYQKNLDSPYAKWDWKSDVPGWERGFGQKIFGETWVAHHGVHGKEGTRALISGRAQNEDHPILRGVNDIWGPSDVYAIKNLPKTADILIYGQSTSGMTPDSPVNLDKSIMPIAWTIPYQIEGGKPGKAFVTTMGASLDFQNEDLRRLILNASMTLLGMGDLVSPDLNVDYVGNYSPTMFGFGTFREGMRVSDFK
ncbi:ThuA domain-containing protein [Algoriphagus sediminis]|uniref:ThuA domain-containing protein n=1 Tax=Algoriphagus sediminis TaxID=3057113 RepID=A0ABT7Y929_9BACT|nr:ThuA domain-containing protein [Algoriphagus sediminis]MDN3203005.1 ThuA domain-containing protein [Algoriphagus sediminis]